ncbi:hypothetical protein [Salinibacterium sp. SWN167]|uniref:hypothetical protein n=1 Tax=Salinibacterium sp. SWN167 TaxID=2792054 RepID=UPI0018CDF6BA|nr:hypothetical protein [Salinibacterium sp. SWN167]MBH0082974.1 hypothetical protein [Salinibacterium sp. SWN167]
MLQPVKKSGGFLTNNWNLIWGIPLTIVYLASYFAPVWGFANISSGGRFATAAPDPNPARAIPITGIFFIIEIALLLVSLGHWLATGRRRNGFYQVQAWLALVFGILSAISVSSKGNADRVENWQFWLMVIVSSVVLAIVVLIWHLVIDLGRSARRELGSVSADEASLPNNKVALLKLRRQAIKELSENEQTQIRHDFDAAIDDLEQRGLVPSDQANRARSVDLGALEMLMTRPR